MVKYTWTGGEEEKCRELGHCSGKRGLWQGPECFDSLQGHKKIGGEDGAKSGTDRGHKTETSI